MHQTFAISACKKPKFFISRFQTVLESMSRFTSFMKMIVFGFVRLAISRKHLDTIMNMALFSGQSESFDLKRQKDVCP
jgi:hypothetical protein